MKSMADEYQRLGYFLLPECLSPSVVQKMCSLTDAVRQNDQADEAVSNQSGVYALRNLTNIVPETTELISEPIVTDVVTRILGPNAFMVRATFFDKTQGANWGVFWHQDLSIAVRQRKDVPGFHAWTRKAGVLSVQPPTEIMSQVLAVRLHLDDCTNSNGALRVLPGTHHNGRLCAGSLDAAVHVNSEVVCEVPAGGAVLMNPLTLHASSPMATPGHRRVIHFEFAASDLPEGLEWEFRIPLQK